MPNASIDDRYDYWFHRTNDPQAAATLVMAEVTAGDPATPASGPLSVKAAAKRLGVSKEIVYKLCADNELPHNRIGRRITITPQQLDVYLNRPRFQR